uniref:CD248 molecule, endosialin b n=1 Tax=Paramormyrops kingsleyae TaxID=1676925 RepID=A0A3B3RK29_9TELE|nr:endosialin-like [Paramormyrops kingsleyae]
MRPAMHGYVLLSVIYGFWSPWVWGQELKERDALCSEDGCFVVYFQRKTFLDSWRSCKEKGGNLATLKRREDADLIGKLFSGVEPRGPRSRVRLWIGLQRQPRQCSATRPLRGFTWVTGDQDTRYTNWLRDDSASTCTAPRCVVMIHDTEKADHRDNFKWLDGSCSLPVDGFLCRYTYMGMCRAMPNEGGGAARYTTPFNLHTSLLSYLPFGTVATVPCPDGTKGDQSVLCMLREDEKVGWSRDAPLCSDTPTNWCEEDNGGCNHYCINAETHYYCGCSDGFLLDKDGQTCVQVDNCLGVPCEFECQPTLRGYLCTCPEGYLLAPNGHDCLDIDECLQSPCPQLCINAPGTFECRCGEGYQADAGGDCQDVDECLEDRCAHSCENLPGSFSCHCRLGYSPVPEDPSRCQDTDECQIPGTCHQMCVNYEGGFECHCEEGRELQPDGYSCMPVQDVTELPAATISYLSMTSLPGAPWVPQIPDFWVPPLPDWLTDSTSLNWLTEATSLEQLPTDQTQLTDTPSARPTDGRNNGRAVPDWTGKTRIASLAPTATPDWSEEESTTSSPDTPDWIEEESTAMPSVASTSPSGWSAWQWWWQSSTSGASEDYVGQEGDGHLRSRGAESEKRATTPSGVSTTSPKSKAGVTIERHTPPLFLTPHTPSTPAPGQSGSEGKQRQDRSWLVVALLVPLSIFVVIMLALGIVYCTRCAVQPRSKSAADCYRWITNSRPDTSSATKSRV